MLIRPGVLNTLVAMDGMEDGNTYERRLQRLRNSFLIIVPAPIVRHLEAKVGKNITFHTLPGKVVLTYADRDLTKKDIKEIDKYEEAINRLMGPDEEESEKPQTRAGPSRLEKLRIK